MPCYNWVPTDVERINLVNCTVRLQLSSLAIYLITWVSIFGNPQIQMKAHQNLGLLQLFFIGFQYVKGSSYTDKHESLNQPVAEQSHLKHSSCVQSGSISQLCKQYLSAGYILSSDPTITILKKRIVTDLEVILGKPWLCLLHLSASAALKEIFMKTGPRQDLILFHFDRNTTLIESEMCPFTGLYQQGCLLTQGIEP